jgi:hypothetical protein
MQRMRHTAGPDVQSEPVAQQRRDLAVRQAQLFVEQDDQGDRVWSQMGTGGAERVGGLQRVAALHATAAALAAADMHVEPAHVRSHHRQILLHLRGDARLGHRAATVRARRRQRDVNRLVDRRRSPVTVAAVPPSPSPTGTTRLRRRRAVRERRRLTLAGAPRRVKRLCQSPDVAPQALALSFEPNVLIPQSIAFISRPLNLTAQPLQLSLRVVDRLRGVASRHATVMADSRKEYKSNFGSAAQPANQLPLELVERKNKSPASCWARVT